MQIFTFAATADAQVKSDSPTKNFGTLTSLPVREDPTAGTSPWQESTITWATAPTSAALPVASLGAVKPGTWIEIDLGTTVTALKKSSPPADKCGDLSSSLNQPKLSARDTPTNHQPTPSGTQP